MAAEAAEVASSRRRVRAGLLVLTATLAVVVVVVVGGGWAVVRGGLLGRSGAAPAAAAGVPTGTAAGTRTNVVERQQAAGTLGYGDSVTLVGQTQRGDAGGRRASVGAARPRARPRAAS